MATSPNVVSAEFDGGRPRSGIDTALSSVWGRLLFPSLSDLFFIALTVWLFCTGEGWKTLLADGDTGWHIRTGDYILRSGSVPRADLFSWSKPGEAWFAWEWLTDVWYSVLHSSLGLKGIVLWSGLVISGGAVVLLRHMIWRGANMFAALVVTCLILGGSNIHHLARPHLITLLFLAISMWIIDFDRRQPGRWIWSLVPLTVLWTNMHGGFLALIAVLGLLTAGSAVEQAIATGWKGLIAPQVSRYAILTAVCTLASLINPYGIGLHIHISSYLQSSWIKEAIQEFHSPSFRSESAMQFELLLFVGLITVGSLFARKRITDGLWILYFAHSALVSVRHVPLYLIVASPLIVTELTSWWSKAAAGAKRSSTIGILDQLSTDILPGFRRTSIWVLGFVAILVALGSPIRWPSDFPDVKFPTKIAGEYRELLVGSRLFTTDQWGDYLIYRNYPEQKVWVDGRSDFYGPEIGRQYVAFTQGEHNWDRVLAKHAFDVVLVPVNWPVAALLKQRPEWRVLADDGQAILMAQANTPLAAKALEKKVDPGLMKKTNTAESTRETNEK